MTPSPLASFLRGGGAQEAHGAASRSCSPQEILRRLRSAIPGCPVLSEPEELRPYECDGLTAYRETPLAVAIPESIAQVQEILRVCCALRLPVIPRGAGTGLSGGALPRSGGLLLSMARFRKILALDPLNRTARVEPGVTNRAISEAAAPHGLFYAPDPSSEVACTIGGNIAENAGGLHCLKYGLTVHNVLAVKILTPEAELLTLGAEALDSAGFDLLALFVGSEGLLGVVVEATVRLLPRPPLARLIVAAFASVDSAAAAVGKLIGRGFVPAALEMMDNLAIRAAEEFVHAGYPMDAAALLLCECDGPPEEVDEQIALAEEQLRESGAYFLRLSCSEEERLLLWKGRKSAFPAAGRMAPDYYCMDGTIPRRALPEALRRIARLSAEYGLPVANVFHAGDGNLHPLILYDASRPDELKRAESLGGRISELCVELGGVITGEHGVGVEKLDQMCIQFRAAELAQFHRIKDAFDPEGILNPGKAVPLLHRCAELGAMHVHRGTLPFPGIERF
ncbi:glycolate oxidase [Methylacidimicrobium tartarophylax]|uniref:Glycolate oxidase n=1 Tax=Methylacidimicrobium tartarophylax TaxID=1041768 RepID=A0A5E6MG22_9BACT|nr:glycolate oxidase [Methylacidimicrobium tartarophylax]